MTIPADEKVSEIDDLAELLDEAGLEEAALEENAPRRGKRVVPSRSARAEAPPRETDSSEDDRDRLPAEIDDNDDGPRRERTIRRGGVRRTASGAGEPERDEAERADGEYPADDARTADGREADVDAGVDDNLADEDAAEIDTAEIDTDAGEDDGVDPGRAQDGRSEPAETDRPQTRQITARIPPARTRAPVRVPDPGYGTAADSEDDEFDDAGLDDGGADDQDEADTDRNSGRRDADRRESRRKGRRGAERRNSERRNSDPVESEGSDGESESGESESGAPDTEFVPSRRGRGGYDPEADAIARAARYTFRQRAVLALMLTALTTGALGLIFSPLIWYGTGLSILVLGAYLAYLRKQVRMEEEIRRRRAARLGRRRREPGDDEEFDDQPLDADERVRIATGGMDRATARALRRRSSLLDVDDEDPLFEHLEPFDPATARALRRRTGTDPRRQASGE